MQNPKSAMIAKVSTRARIILLARIDSLCETRQHHHNPKLLKAADLGPTIAAHAFVIGEKGQANTRWRSDLKPSQSARRFGFALLLDGFEIVHRVFGILAAEVEGRHI